MRRAKQRATDAEFRSTAPSSDAPDTRPDQNSITSNAKASVSREQDVVSGPPKKSEETASTKGGRRRVRRNRLGASTQPPKADVSAPRVSSAPKPAGSNEPSRVTKDAPAESAAVTQTPGGEQKQGDVTGAREPFTPVAGPAYADQTYDTPAAGAVTAEAVAGGKEAEPIVETRLEGATEKKEAASHTAWVEEIARLGEEVVRAREAYAEACAVDEDEQGLLKKVQRLIKRSTYQRDPAFERTETQYKNAVARLHNAELGRVKEAELSSRGREEAMVQALRYLKVDEVTNLYQARTQAKHIENEKSFVGRIARKTHDFFVWYNKQPIKVKIAFAAGWAALAAGTGGVAAAPVIVALGRYGFGGMSASTALNALTEQYAQSKRQKLLIQEHESTKHKLRDDDSVTFDESKIEDGSAKGEKDPDTTGVEVPKGTAAYEEAMAAFGQGGRESRETDTKDQEILFKNYEKHLDESIGQLTTKTDKWIKQDKTRRWIGRAVGFAAVPVVQKLLAIGMDTETGKALQSKLGSDFKELVDWTKKTLGPQTGLKDPTLGLESTPQSGGAAGSPSDIASQSPGVISGVESVKVGSGGPLPDQSSPATAPESATAEMSVRKEYLEYLAERPVAAGDTLWKYSTELAGQLGIENKDKFAILVQQAVEERMKAHPGLLQQAGFLNEQLHLAADGKLDLSQVLEVEKLEAMAEAAKAEGVTESVANQPAGAVEGAMAESVAPQTTGLSELPRVEPEPVGPVKLVDVAQSPDNRITFFDGSETSNASDGEQGSSPRPEAVVSAETPSPVAEKGASATPAANPEFRGVDKSIYAPKPNLPPTLDTLPPDAPPSAESAPKLADALKPGVTPADLTAYLHNLPQTEQRVVFRGFQELTRQVLYLDPARVRYGDIPNNGLYNPFANPHFAQAEVATILEPKFIRLKSENPLHSSQLARLRELVSYAQAHFGPNGAPGVGKVPGSGEKLPDYLMRLSALFRANGKALPQLLPGSGGGRWSMVHYS